MEYGLIGEKLGHTFSPAIHAMIAPYRYEAREMTGEELHAFLLSRDFRAVNVTIPYKQDVIPYLEHIDDDAREIGAVNVIVNRGGTLYGYNTDAWGMTYMLSAAGFDLHGEKVLVLGTGGTSRTAAFVLARMGASEILRVSRTAGEGVITYEDAYLHHTDARYILNTTPVGMYPNGEASPIRIEAFPHLAGVADVVYNPIETRLARTARERGIPTATGLRMLVGQAVRAAELFRDVEVSGEQLEDIYRRIFESKGTLYLTGMPACGKTTVGRLLAEQIGRPFRDLDEVIEAREGCDIPTIFATHGEEYFRRLEREALVYLAETLPSAVVATGGGAILAPENRALMRANGRCVFIDRDPCNLTPTGDRPTASTREAIEQRYRERYCIYRESADLRVDGNGTPTEVLHTVIKELKK